MGEAEVIQHLNDNLFVGRMVKVRTSIFMLDKVQFSFDLSATLFNSNARIIKLYDNNMIESHQHFATKFPFVNVHDWPKKLVFIKQANDKIALRFSKPLSDGREQHDILIHCSVNGLDVSEIGRLIALQAHMKLNHFNKLR